MRLVGPDVLTFSLAEAEALAATLNASFATEGMRFLTPTPDRWYVHLAAPPQAVFTPLQQAILRDMRQAMPTGAEGKRWSRYLNEVQMLWFEHPVNQQREQQGEPALNSVWFWGETTPLPTQVAKPNFLILPPSNRFWRRWHNLAIPHSTAHHTTMRRQYRRGRNRLRS